MSFSSSISRRALLATLAGVGAGAALPATAFADSDYSPKVKPGNLLFSETFGSRRLDRTLWNPWITDVGSGGVPWFYRPELGQPNSAIGWTGGFTDEYDLASNVTVGEGELNLLLTPGSPVDGYTHTGAVINSLPTHGDYGDGITQTPGFTFSDARVEIVARMPDSSTGGWGSIWFMNADPGTPGNWEFDLVETGMMNWDGTEPANTITSNYHPTGFAGQRGDLDLGEPVDANFHTYAFEYKSGQYMRGYVDDKLVLGVTEHVATCPMFVIISNQVASSETLWWHTQKEGIQLGTDLVVRSIKAWAI